MSRRCQISGAGPNSANNVSHANNKSKRRQLPNLHTKRIFVPELGHRVKIRVTSKVLKTIDKNGLNGTLKQYGLTIQDLL